MYAGSLWAALRWAGPRAKNRESSRPDRDSHRLCATRRPSPLDKPAVKNEPFLTGQSDIDHLIKFGHSTRLAYRGG